MADLSCRAARSVIGGTGRARADVAIADNAPKWRLAEDFARRMVARL